MRNTQVAPQADSAASIEELNALAGRGSATTWITLGWIYQHGDGVTVDVRQAEHFYKQGMALGDARAKFYLARLFVDMGAFDRALPMFVEGAECGHLPSTYWAGRLYMRGDGVSSDSRKAESYLRHAAERGHLFARRDYSTGLLNGAFGKRKLVKGLVGRISVIFVGANTMVSDPESELLM